MCPSVLAVLCLLETPIKQLLLEMYVCVNPAGTDLLKNSLYPQVIASGLRPQSHHPLNGIAIRKLIYAHRLYLQGRRGKNLKSKFTHSADILLCGWRSTPTTTTYLH